MLCRHVTAQRVQMLAGPINLQSKKDAGAHEKPTD
jgi:hypothetical protein